MYIKQEQIVADVVMREQEQRVSRGQGSQARCTEEKVEADAAVNTTDGARARCCIPGSSHKKGTDVAKATGISTSVSILLLFHFTQQKAAKRGSAHNPPLTRISLPEFISIKCDTFFLST